MKIVKSQAVSTSFGGIKTGEQQFREIRIRKYGKFKKMATNKPA